MNQLGWDVHSFDHEDANSQFELDFSYTDVMSMADRFVLWRLMTKLLARQYGFEATFMPKPYADRTGNGGHFNMSMSDLETGSNAFDDPDDPRGAGVSKLAYQFIAGVLAHAPAISAVTAPTVNSYKRLIKTGSMTGFTWAPVYISFGANNRTHMLRIPMGGGRVESRAVDTACNPYLAAAILLGAGLEGIENDLDPGDPIRAQHVPAERRAAGRARRERAPAHAPRGGGGVQRRPALRAGVRQRAEELVRRP